MRYPEIPGMRGNVIIKSVRAGMKITGADAFYIFYGAVVGSNRKFRNYQQKSGIFFSFPSISHGCFFIL